MSEDKPGCTKEDLALTYICRTIRKAWEDGKQVDICISEVKNPVLISVKYGGNKIYAID